MFSGWTISKGRFTRGLKKPSAKADRFQPGLFSHLFNVAASRPAKSPRDNSAILLLAACFDLQILGHVDSARFADTAASTPAAWIGPNYP